MCSSFDFNSLQRSAGNKNAKHRKKWSPSGKSSAIVSPVLSGHL